MEIHYYDSLPSTNRAAAEAARGGAGEFYTVAAREQTAGRGRLTRSFFSPAGGTYFSTVLRPDMPPARYLALTPLAAVAVHRALLRLTGVCADIKWVNDLLLHDKKLCGILSESGQDEEGKPFVILGIGINTGTADFPAELREIATALPIENTERLIREILCELSDYKKALAAGSWLSYYREHCVFLGKEVLVIDSSGKRRARALDICENGALEVLFEGGERGLLQSGEISLRSARKDEKRHNL